MKVFAVLFVRHVKIGIQINEVRDLALNQKAETP